MFDMQVLLSDMQKSCSRCKVFASRAAKPECRTTIFTGRPAVFASRVAKPECRTTIFTGRPDRLLFYYFYYFTISFPFGSRQSFFASQVAKPECRTTIFTGRPAVFASRVAKPECRTTIFTGRPAVCASRVAKPECRTTIFTGRPAVCASRVAKPECRTTIFPGPAGPFTILLFYCFTISFSFGSRQRFFACRAANPTRPPHPSMFQRFFCISDSLFCMSAHVFACRPNVSPVLGSLESLYSGSLPTPTPLNPTLWASLNSKVRGHYFTFCLESQWPIIMGYLQ